MRNEVKELVKQRNRLCKQCISANKRSRSKYGSLTVRSDDMSDKFKKLAEQRGRLLKEQKSASREIRLAVQYRQRLIGRKRKLSNRPQ